MAPATVAPAELGDMDLMRRVQTGDVLAFGALFDRFASRAYRVALAIARDETRAEDIVQDAFLSLWHGRADYRPQRGAVVGWIMGTVRRRAIAAQAHVDAEPSAAGRDQAAELHSVLARLPAEQRDVIALAYFGRLSASEIAAELSLPLGTVKGRMRLGLTELRTEPTP